MKQAYLHNQFLYALAGVVICFCLGFAYPLFFGLGQLALLALLLLLVFDFYLLFRLKWSLDLDRQMAAKLSNGDWNPINYQIQGKFPFKPQLELIDEYPTQLQLRKESIWFKQLPKEFEEQHTKSIRPIERGEYGFGQSHILVNTPLRLIRRRISFDNSINAHVYPSFIQYKKYVFLAFSNRLQELGVKKIRRLGGVTEFEQIREYVRGDDYRRINWKATARRKSLMVNHYDEEKAQNIFLLIDKGRMMHMPFDGMALVDYAINSALVMSGIALGKGDKVGLVTFSNVIGSFINARQDPRHINTITEALYNQEARDKDSDFLRLLKNVRTRITRRSLFLLYTNFESKITLDRQLPYLKAIAKYHVLVVIIFENDEVKHLAQQPTESYKRIFEQSMAEQYMLDKNLMVSELARHGIQTILTSPNDLSLNTINKYLELKAKGYI